MQPSGVTQTSRHSKGEERDLHMDNMKQTNAKGKETHIQEQRSSCVSKPQTQNMRNDPRGQGCGRGSRIRHTARPGRTRTALGGVTTRRGVGEGHLGHVVHTALSLCSLSMMAFSLCMLVQSRLSAVRPLPRLPFWLCAVANFPTWLKACAYMA